MTPEQQLTIRAELARRMGWQVEGGRWLPPGTALPLKYGNSGFPIAPPNPFESAEDKDRMVTWLAADDDRWESFHDELFRSYDMWQGAGLSAPIRNALTAPRETITLAAARALGIGEEE